MYISGLIVVKPIFGALLTLFFTWQAPSLFTIRKIGKVRQLEKMWNNWKISDVGF